MNLMCMFDHSDRDTLIGDIGISLPFIDDSEMAELMRQTTCFVGRMSDEEFAEIEFIPMWDDEEDVYV